jgi:hypothetical protein
MRRFAFTLLALGIALVACSPGTAPVPTPFPTPAATPTLPSQTTVALGLTDLVTSPGLYLDVPVQVSGRFRRQPLLVCPADPHPGPTSWALGEAGLEVPASGFDQEVRALLPEELTVVVEGRLRRWQGLVGCGKRAQEREIWYLEVARILSPNPLAQITLTPGGEATAIADAGGGTEEASTPDPFLTPDALSTVAPFATATADPFAPEPTEPFGAYPGQPTEPVPDFPTDEPTPSFDTPDPFATQPSETASPTPATGTPAPGTPTPGTTGTPSATPTQGSTTPTATTGAPGDVVDMGDIYNLAEEFTTSRIEANTVHRWTIEIFEDETFTVNVIAPAPADLILTISLNGQPIVNRQNTSGPGVAETVREPSLSGEGIYEIVVESAGGAATDYAIAAYIAGDFDIQFKGFLTSSTPQSNITMAPDESHYWFFIAGAGNQLTATLTPDSASDIIGEFFGPEAEALETIDDGIAGEAETLAAFPLPVSGLHAVRVTEIDYLGMNYTILITLQ